MSERLPQVVILAAGEAKRLYPISQVLPKILIPVLDKPLGFHILEYLHEQGASKVLLCVNERFADLIKSVFGNGEQFGLELSYSVSKGLGTAGEIHNAKTRNLLEKDFIIYYGDILTDFDLQSFWKAHSLDQADLTIAVSSKAKVPFGVLIFGDSLEMIEKPSLNKLREDAFATMGILAVSSQATELFKPNLDIFADIVPKALNSPDLLTRVHISEADWFDCGTWSRIEKAEAWLRSRVQRSKKK